MSQTKATLIGFSAVLMWALLALMTVGTAPLPPLQLNAICFAIAGVIGIAWTMATGGLGQLTAVPIKVYALGTAGLFGYHFLYFSALRAAPPAQAGLIAYLWPLLIVMFSGLLPGERLTARHIIGAVIAFAGAAILVADGMGSLSASALTGYGLAFLCALTWSSYSVLSRRAGQVPTAAVTVFCLASAALSVVAHLLIETPQWPTAALGWAAVIALGVGPVGLAFFVWDIGVKRGNIQLLGVASYAAPVLSTLVLVMTGLAPMSPVLLVSAVLVAGGAFIASRRSKG